MVTVWGDPVVLELDTLNEGGKGLLQSYSKLSFSVEVILKSEFQKFQKYRVINKFLFLQNNCSHSNFNRIFNYEFGTQGPSLKVKLIRFPTSNAIDAFVKESLD